MEKPYEQEQTNLKMKHFARLHEKIQYKYEEMQRKLEKSRSVDSLPTLTEENMRKHQKFASNHDIREADEVFFDDSKSDSDKYSPKHRAVIEDVHNSDGSFHYADVKDMSESEFSFTPNEMYDSSNYVTKFFGDDFSKISVESLNEVAKESDEGLTPPQPPSRVSIRNKIGSRISAVKEKRRRREKEKMATKDKKKESREKVEKFILSNTTKQDIIKVFKKTKLATVTIALIEVTGLETDASEEKSRVLFCRFKLGTEKHKSKIVKSNASAVKYQELFNFSMYEENMMEISLWDKDVFIGRSIIDLFDMKKEKTHKMRLKLEGPVEKAQIFILLTISGSQGNTLMDLEDYEEAQKSLMAIRKKFVWYYLTDDSTDVGWLSIILYGAKGITGTDCFCILELANERLITHTDHKTCDPNWMKTFTFTVTDITSILEITVHDEKKGEDSGKVSIPLLRIENGKKKWYALKDVTQRERAKGQNPRILLEMMVTWNPIKASMRAINPKEYKLLETEVKLDRHIFANNLSRSKAVVSWILDAFQVVKSCFEWESKQFNILALTTWLLFCWFFKVWMLPLLVLIPFLWYRPPKYYLVNWRKRLNQTPILEGQENEDERTTTLFQKLNSLQEMVQTVQNAIGTFASLGERIKNLFNFTVPFLSFLAIIIVIMISFVMFLIPVKYIFMFWGIHKFTRKILRPNRIPNNEILDLLSRVHDDEILNDCEELPLEEMSKEDVIE